ATDPLLCAAGEESLDIVVEEDMAGKTARIESRIKRALAEMAAEFELIGDIPGRGGLLGVGVVTDRGRKRPAQPQGGEMASLCLEHGLIFQLRGTQGDLNVIRLVPPMIATEAEVDRAMSIMRDAIRVVSRSRPSVSRAAE